MASTTVPADLHRHREQFMQLTGLQGDEVGIAPDARHKKGGGYHCGQQDLADIGKYHAPANLNVGKSTEDYSVRQRRDRGLGGNVSSAMDKGDNWPNGGRAAWLRYNNMVVAQMRSGDPKLAALRAVNFSPDGTQRKRYDSLHPEAGVIDSTDNVDIHTHEEWWRDTAGTPLREVGLGRLLEIARAAINNQPLDGGEDEDDMGASFGPITIEREGFTSLTIPPVQDGAADPRQAWLNFNNDCGASVYALRIWYSTGSGFAPFPGTNKDGLLVLKSGQRWSQEIPAHTSCLSVLRMAIDKDGNVVPATADLKVFSGHLTLCIERGPVIKK